MLEIVDAIIVLLISIGGLYTLNNAISGKSGRKSGSPKEKATKEALEYYENTIENYKNRNKSLQARIWNLENGAEREIAQLGEGADISEMLDAVWEYVPAPIKSMVSKEQAAELVKDNPEIVQKIIGGAKERFKKGSNDTLNLQGESL